MELYLIPFLLVTVFVTGGYGDTASKVICIDGKFKQAIGSSYTSCTTKSGATAIPKIKQCFQEHLKTAQVIKVASNGQMTVNKAKFTEWGSSNSNHDVGKGVQTCATKPKEHDMYKEAARAVQCVFEEVKKKCK